MENMKQEGWGKSRAGFTMTEAMLASFIALLVGTATMAVFLWCVRQFSLTSKIAWSQNEAMRSSNKIAAYIKNASAVSGIDTNTNGTWIQLTFPNGTVGKLVYSNAAPLLRNGWLYLKVTNSTEVLVARGLMRIPDDNGGALPFFQKTKDNWVRVAYRVSEPMIVTNTPTAADDADFAASVRFGVCLRNVTPPP